MQEPLIDRLVELEEILKGLYSKETEGLSFKDILVVKDVIEFVAEKEYGFKA